MARLGPIGLNQLLTDIKNWVNSKLSTKSDTAHTHTAYAVKHTYTTAASAAKNWYRIANANTKQVYTGNPIHAEFILTAYNSSYDPGYSERWYVRAMVLGRNAHVIIFGGNTAPFSQCRVLYENTLADIDDNDRPAIDIYLNYVLANGTTKIEIEEVYNQGWTFVADGQLAVSTVPTGFENVAVSIRGNGVERSTYSDIATYLNKPRRDITSNVTLADNTTYRSTTLNCTGTRTITLPSINSNYFWCVIKNFNAEADIITIHPSTTSVLIDGSNDDIILRPGEFVAIHSRAANSFTIVGDNRKRTCLVGRSGEVGTDTKHWFRVAQKTLTTRYRDAFILLDVFHAGCDSNYMGRLCAHVRVDNTIGVVGNKQFTWLYRGTQLSDDDFAMTTIETSGTSVVVDIWCKRTGGYSAFEFVVVSEGFSTDSPDSPAGKWILTRARATVGDLESLDTGFTTVTNPSVVTLANSITGKASNVTGTVAIANGGTGATTRLNAVKNLTNESVGTPTHFLAITTNWGKAGYTTVAQAKTVLGITGDMGSHSDSEYVHMSGDETVAGVKTFSNNTYITSLNFTSEVESQSSSSSAVFPIVTTVTYADQSPSQTARLNFRITANGDKSLYPHENNQYSFGVTSRRWATLYGYLANLGGTYLGNEASPNERTNLYLLANRDADGQSGAYIGRFRQNRTQGAMESSDVSYITFDFLENSTRYTRCFTMGMTDWDNDKVPQTYYLTSPDGKGSLGTATTAWNKVYANSYYLGTTSFTDKFVTTDTAQTITGVKTLNNDTLVANQGNAYRIANSAGTGYGVFQRTDGTYWYMLVTANNDPLGTWTNARPITIRLSDGYCTINGKANEANKVQATIAADATTALVQATVASNDCFRIAAGGAANAGWAEIATGDDANEPIYVRQYKGSFTTLQRTATLLDGSGNTSFPGTVTATGFSGPLTGTATKATGNANGNEITDTVIKGLSISGKTITYTKIDGNTGTLTTQDTVYTHPTTSGNKHIPSGGSSGQFLGWDSDGTAKWVNNPNTNTDTLMTQNVSTTDSTYPILLCATANATSNQGAKTGIFGSGVKVNPKTSVVSAKGFSGVPTGTTYVTAVKDGGALVNSQTTSWGAIWRAPTKDYQVAGATWSSNNNNVYICYSVTNANAEAGTNTMAKSLIWAADTGTLTTTTFSGALSGNASSATEFSANKDVTLTGDVTGTASSKAGWSVATTLANSGVTAGTYGPSADVTGSNNATILVPEITVDAKGRVTAVTNRTYTSVNTDSDKKVYQYYKSDDNVYRLLFSNNAGNTATSNVGAVYSGLNNSFYVNPSTGALYATKLYSNGVEVLTSHQSLSNYATLNTAQEITNTKTFKDANTVVKRTDIEAGNTLPSADKLARNIFQDKNGKELGSIYYYKNPRGNTGLCLRAGDWFSESEGVYSLNASGTNRRAELVLYTNSSGDCCIQPNGLFSAHLKPLNSSICLAEYGKPFGVAYVNQVRFTNATLQVDVDITATEEHSIGFFGKNNGPLSYITFQKRPSFKDRVAIRVQTASSSYKSYDFDATCFYPESNNSVDIGSTTNIFKNIYCNNYYKGTTAFGDIVTHNASEFLTQHPSITLSTNTTSTESPSHGGTFTCIDSVTQDANGHITLVNTKTVTLPADSNTDTKVTQTSTAASSDYPVILGNTANNTATVTEGTRFSKCLYVNARYGNISIKNAYNSANTKGVRDSATTYQNGIVVFKCYDGSEMGRIHSESNKGGYNRTFIQARNYIKDGAINPEGTAVTAVFALDLLDNGSKRVLTDANWGCNIQPDANNSRTLGTSSLRWKECYSNAYYLGTTAFGDIVTHNASEFLTSHQSLDNYVTLDSNQTITAIKTITGGNQGKMIFKNPNFTVGTTPESATTVTRIYFGGGASYDGSTGAISNDIASNGNSQLEICALNNNSSSSYRTSLILRYEQDQTRPRFIKSWGDFCPYSDNTYYLGRSDSVWKECYCNAYYLGTTAFGDIVTHNASEFLTSHQSLSSCVKNVVTNNQIIKSTGITRGTAPSSAQTFGIAFSDNNNKSIGNVYGQYATDKSTYVGLYAYKGTTTSNGDNASVRVGYDASGNAYTYAPTPATADNSTQIATTAFVKAQGYLTSHQSLANYVTTNTDQSISGIKSHSKHISILGDYVGNESSTNGRSCLYLKANRDTDGKSGLYVTKFRQNVAQGSMGSSDVVFLSHDILENETRTNAGFVESYSNWTNNVPGGISVYSTIATRNLGTSAKPWTNAYITNLNLNGNVFDPTSVSGNIGDIVFASAYYDDITGTLSLNLTVSGNALHLAGFNNDTLVWNADAASFSGTWKLLGLGKPTGTSFIVRTGLWKRIL